jgi:hypothetical protein
VLGEGFGVGLTLGVASRGPVPGPPLPAGEWERPAQLLELLPAGQRSAVVLREDIEGSLFRGAQETAFRLERIVSWAAVRAGELAPGEVDEFFVEELALSFSTSRAEGSADHQAGSRP